mmetsp:Transcript_100713/g.178810  ORF Transcript_100713/g.178810 Transcript_100713/m.178810 type:complete len:189 (+) Transcript_100713:1-567(+)
MDWIAEFMDSFPVMVRPAHLVEFRKFMQAVVGEGEFEAAYQKYRSNLEYDALLRGRHTWYLAEGECPYSSLPTFLYHYYRHEYFWSMEDGHLFGLPPEDCCLAFRISSHLSRQKSLVRNKSLSEEEYVRAARNLMRLGRERRPSLRVALLSATFQADATWKEASSLHCRHRHRQTMLDVYFKRWHARE